MQPTPRRNIRRRRHIIAQQHFLALDVGMVRQSGGKERLGVGMQRAREELLGFRKLHHAAQIHHADHVAHVAHGAQMMGDEEIAVALGLLEGFQEVHDLRADRHIQRGHGLVEHDHPGVGGDGPGDGEPLALAA